MTAREAALDRALGMTIAALEVALQGSGYGCGVFCDECKAAIARMLEEAKRLRREGRSGGR